MKQSAGVIEANEAKRAGVPGAMLGEQRYRGELRGVFQDGRGVRCGDHLSPHKYIKNTSTCGTTPTEHLLNAGRRPQTSQKARNSPRTWVGQKEKEKTDTKE